jgi:hypothetical protein
MARSSFMAVNTPVEKAAKTSHMSATTNARK